MRQLIDVRPLSQHSREALRAEVSRLTEDEQKIARAMVDTRPLRLLIEPAPPAVTDGLRSQLERVGGDTILADSGDAALVLGTQHQIADALDALDTQADMAARAVGTEIRVVLRRFAGIPDPITIGPLECDWRRRTYVMGIINVTPDSFSGDGVVATGDEWVTAAVTQAKQMIEHGADILDIGGESTRPGATPVAEEEELARIVPAVEAIAGELDVAISVDTYKAEVARQALEAGAHLINDVWGLRMDPDMAGVVAEYGVPVIVIHNRSRPKSAVQEARLGGRYVGIEYDNLMADIVRELEESINLAVNAGIPWEQIIVDPGVGFGKTVEQNLMLLNRLDELQALGRPILLGPSRKGFIGFTLDLPADERVEGTGVTVTLGIERGANVIRVHDVREMVRVARMTDAVLRERPAPA